MPAVSIFAPTSDLYINGVLNGTKWGVSSLTFSFPSSSAYYGTPYGSGESITGFEAFTPTQQAAVRSILKQYSSVINFTFTEVTETSATHGDLRYAESDLPSTAWSYYPSTAAIGGDAWFNNSGNKYDSPVVGNYAWLTMMHETGHAMGLKHPHSAFGQFSPMPVDRDSLEYSVMSYRSYVGASTSGGLTSEAFGYPQSLMMYDIAGLQEMYGANYATNSGNTIYTWNPLTGQGYINGVAQAAPGANRILLTVWDGGGQDTYDFSNYSTNLKVDLSPGGWTTTSSAQLAYIGAGKYAVGNIANALLYHGNVASLVENAIGGIGNDTIVGNVADNRLTGGSGNDMIDGGTGNDTAVYSGLSTNYKLVLNANGSWTITDLRTGSVDGSDILTNIEKVQFSNTLLTLGSTIPANQPPVVTAPNVTATSKQVMAASSLFTVTDADNNAITKYQFWDDTAGATSGYFVTGGVAKAAGTMIDVTAAQLSQTSFVAGSASDLLWVRAFDGTSWSAWDDFTVTTANQPPVVTAPNVTAASKQAMAVSSLFTVTDADNNAITQYQFWDDTAGATSGYFVTGGVAKAAGTMIDVTAAQLSQTSFVAGSASDLLWVRAFDGTSWSAWDDFTVTTANQPPVVTAPNVTAASKQAMAASSLFTVTDADNNAITKYQFWDDTAGATSGYFAVGGVSQPAQGVVEVAAGYLSKVSFVAGTTSDVLYIRAFDGTSWSAWDDLSVTVTSINQPPVVTAPNVTATSKQVVAASSLFTVTDADNNAITKYQFWDDTVSATSGYFVTGGVAKAADTTIEVTAAQLSQTGFVVGSTSDVLYIRAFDGTSWSAWDDFTVTPAASLERPVSIVGTRVNDALMSTSSNNTMTGGAGSDTFIFGPNFGKDTITDFEIGGTGHDYVGLVQSGLESFADLIAHAEQVGTSVVIAADESNSVTLQNTTVSFLMQHQDHFYFIA